ncbi:hypothetical protein P8631_10175 [Guyparkeria sp. 1SP6A2]|nr:hypothetical protein [Guyparkeria sp. 1SP6A2]
MSEYRDWRHPEGGPPETAPDRLVDVFTAPWLEPGASGPASALEGAAADGRWLVVLVVLVVIVVALYVWRRRRDLMLGIALARLERAARRADAGTSLREMQDRTATAIARWQYGGRAPRRDRLAPPWSEWVRHLDHARFGSGSPGNATDLAEQLRSMRRAAWRGGGPR